MEIKKTKNAASDKITANFTTPAFWPLPNLKLPAHLLCRIDIFPASLVLIFNPSFRTSRNYTFICKKYSACYKKTSKICATKASARVSKGYKDLKNRQFIGNRAKYKIKQTIYI
jgi:hypothetical protein